MSDYPISQLNCLVVDDEHFVLNLTVRILKSLGIKQITPCDNGAQAMELLVQARPAFDIIICDLNMPQMDGIELIQKVAAQQFSGGVIYLSGEDERMLETANDLAKAHQLQVLGGLSKPLNKQALESLLLAYQPLTQGTQPNRKPALQLSVQELQDGLYREDDGLEVYYQPKVCMQSGRIKSVESLVKWRHPTLGLLGPEVFVPLAEESGLVHEMTWEIYRRAIRQTAEWAREGIVLKTSVNFSINTFSQPQFVDNIVKTAAKWQLAPQFIVLEVTETQVMQDMLSCLGVMMTMRLKGFQLSIDDFGTGHSSLAQLKSIPFTELKIDRAFVHQAQTHNTARAILESSVSLARKLSMEVVAEGAETREDWDLLARLGCDYVQGYYCAKPMNAADFRDFYLHWLGPHSL